MLVRMDLYVSHREFSCVILLLILFEELRNLLIHDIRGGGESGEAMAITVYNMNNIGIDFIGMFPFHICY